MLEVASAILPDVIAEEDIRSLPSSLDLPATDPALRHPNSWKGQRFGGYGETDARHRPVDLGPGLWLGTRDANARLIGSYRPERPRTAANGHVVKYEGPRGTRPAFAVPVRCREALLGSKCDIIIPEGYKKALAVASAGGCAIAVAGVDAWSVKPEPDAPGEPIPDFDAIPWHGRTVWLAWDSDIREKDGVQRSEKRLTKELESRGAIVIPLRIPHRPDGSKRGIDDYTSDRLAAGVSREDALAELKSAALAELLRLSRVKREPVTGTDGGETCQSCPELREQIAEYKAGDRLERDGPFTPDAARVHRQLVTTARAARLNGTEKVSLERKDIARLALGDETNTKAVSRALATYKAYQDDPELLPTLPYRLEWREAGRRTHIDLVPLAAPSTTTREQLVTLRQLPRASRPAAIRERDDGCPRCHSPEGVESRSTKRCLNDDCAHIWHTRPVILGRVTADAAPEPTPLPLLVAALPGQNVPASTGLTYAGQNVPAPPPLVTLIPAPTLSRDEYELAHSPHYWGESPPPEPEPWVPPPLAPAHHLARGFKRRPAPADEG
jgi:hypothetical protein